MFTFLSERHNAFLKQRSKGDFLSFLEVSVSSPICCYGKTFAPALETKKSMTLYDTNPCFRNHPPLDPSLCLYFHF